tara:strand:- start:1063506 stop:1064528 length:1023 start_codon:yes stop_codon:yes gene_type:complete
MPATLATRSTAYAAASWFILTILIGLTCQSAIAQDGQNRKDPSTREQTDFAPGVVTVIPPAPDAKETFSGTLTLQDLLDSYPEIRWDAPNFPEGAPHFDPRSRTLTEMAKQVILRREIHCFEFSFKPLRQIYVDVPRADGRLQRKLVWYMVFRIRYRGGDLRPAVDQVAGAPLYKRIESVSYASRRVFPMLKLINHKAGTEYVDRILPTAKDKIAIREQITAPLYNTVEISRVTVPYSSDASGPGVWGVATWTDVDPAMDFVSVNVFGLTNAFEQDEQSADSPYRRKALQLNFFRPGDAILQTEDRIRFGVPAYENEKDQQYVLQQYGLDERLDYRWIFR